jgi:hypothetical protein
VPSPDKRRLGVSNQWLVNARPCAAPRSDSIPAQMNGTTAVDNALYEVQAARRELRMTGFCLHQAEAFRRIDRTRTGLADLAQFSAQ